MLHLTRVRTSRKWNHATRQCSFLLWQPSIQCRLRPEANSSGVQPSAYLPPIGCSAEHQWANKHSTTNNLSNTDVFFKKISNKCKPIPGATLCGAPSGLALSVHVVALFKRAKRTNFSTLRFYQTLQVQARRYVMRHPVGVGIVCTCLCSTCWSPCSSRRDKHNFTTNFCALVRLNTVIIYFSIIKKLHNILPNHNNLPNK